MSAPWAVWKGRAVTYGPLVLAVMALAQRTIAAVLTKVGHAAAVARRLVHPFPVRARDRDRAIRCASRPGRPSRAAPRACSGPRCSRRSGRSARATTRSSGRRWALSFVGPRRARLGGVEADRAPRRARRGGRGRRDDARVRGLRLVRRERDGGRPVRVGDRASLATRERVVRGGTRGARTASRRGARRARVGRGPLPARGSRHGAVRGARPCAAFPRRDAIRDAGALARCRRRRSLPSRSCSGRSRARRGATPPSPSFSPGTRTTRARRSSRRSRRTRSSSSGRSSNGQTYSAEFVPRGGAPLAMAGLGAVARARRPDGRAVARDRCPPARAHDVRALLLLHVPLEPPPLPLAVRDRMDRRPRVPRAPRRRPGGRHPPALARHDGRSLCGAIAGLFASKLDWVIDDVAQSASGIDRQQVALGRWAKESLSPTARIGVNDTGAIAYFSDRSTFDVVGLTTRGGGALLGRRAPDRASSTTSACTRAPRRSSRRTSSCTRSGSAWTRSSASL